MHKNSPPPKILKRLRTKKFLIFGRFFPQGAHASYKIKSVVLLFFPPLFSHAWQILSPFLSQNYKKKANRQVKKHLSRSKEKKSRKPSNFFEENFYRLFFSRLIFPTKDYSDKFSDRLRFINESTEISSEFQLYSVHFISFSSYISSRYRPERKA